MDGNVLVKVYDIVARAVELEKEEENNLKLDNIFGSALRL